MSTGNFPGNLESRSLSRDIIYNVKINYIALSVYVFIIVAYT